MKEEKEKIKNSEYKIFNNELFVTNENEIESTNNFLPKSNSNSNRGSLTNNVRGSQHSTHSNNNERFLSTSLMQNLDCSPRVENETKIEFDKFSKNSEINSVVHLNNSNINEDVLAKIKSQTKNQTKHNYNDLYEDVGEKTDNININQLTQKNEDKKINNNVFLEDPDLRSSGNSVNSNCNLSMNMNLRSSNIFNQTKDNDENQNINQNNNDNIDNEIKNNIDKSENKIKQENKNNKIKEEEEKPKDFKFNTNITPEINYEYIFEKFGKRGWECEKCNNFNFETRNICNRCELPKCPKSLEQIKIENEQKSLERKKQPLIEREGDWKCPKCHNLNFAFRNSCNKCKIPKEIYLKMQKKNTNDKKYKNNFQKQAQIINNSTQQFFQNQFNFIQAWGFPPYFTQKFSIIPAFAINANYRNNQNNVLNNVNNNTVNEKKYQNHQGNFVPKSLLMKNNKFEVNSFNNKKNNNGYNKFNEYNK